MLNRENIFISKTKLSIKPVYLNEPKFKVRNSNDDWTNDQTLKINNLNVSHNANKSESAFSRTKNLCKNLFKTQKENEKVANKLNEEKIDKTECSNRSRTSKRQGLPDKTQKNVEIMKNTKICQKSNNKEVTNVSQGNGEKLKCFNRCQKPYNQYIKNAPQKNAEKLKYSDRCQKPNYEKSINASQKIIPHLFIDVPLICLPDKPKNPICSSNLPGGHQHQQVIKSIKKLFNDNKNASRMSFKDTNNSQTPFKQKNYSRMSLKNKSRNSAPAEGESAEESGEEEEKEEESQATGTKTEATAETAATTPDVGDTASAKTDDASKDPSDAETASTANETKSDTNAPATDSTATETKTDLPTPSLATSTTATKSIMKNISSLPTTATTTKSNTRTIPSLATSTTVTKSDLKNLASLATTTTDTKSDLKDILRLRKGKIPSKPETKHDGISSTVGNNIKNNEAIKSADKSKQNYPPDLHTKIQKKESDRVSRSGQVSPSRRNIQSSRHSPSGRNSPSRRHSLSRQHSSSRWHTKIAIEEVGDIEKVGAVDIVVVVDIHGAAAIVVVVDIHDVVNIVGAGKKSLLKNGYQHLDQEGENGTGGRMASVDKNRYCAEWIRCRPLTPPNTYRKLSVTKCCESVCSRKNFNDVGLHINNDLVKKINVREPYLCPAPTFNCPKAPEVRNIFTPCIANQQQVERIQGWMHHQGTWPFPANHPQDPATTHQQPFCNSNTVNQNPQVPAMTNGSRNPTLNQTRCLTSTGMMEMNQAAMQTCNFVPPMPTFFGPPSCVPHMPSSFVHPSFASSSYVPPSVCAPMSNNMPNCLHNVSQQPMLNAMQHCLPQPMRPYLSQCPGQQQNFLPQNFTLQFEQQCPPTLQQFPPTKIKANCCDLETFQQLLMLEKSLT
ncbi:hypothetical protein HELRODRAFT_168926 [Helobdella robusta]|uniref:Uncharacterized protein n=1 Tax=Helobdella robusta TaxID=6412 RepID=T1F153_HELRO|nr:hypothetical protein HELRODRAFT_168926 [Helobdella robusta]ESO08996.1 hypothetical protein HELRODRAFT_168926 [Helobdella robusta]